MKTKDIINHHLSLTASAEVIDEGGSSIIREERLKRPLDFLFINKSLKNKKV